MLIIEPKQYSHSLSKKRTEAQLGRNSHLMKNFLGEVECSPKLVKIVRGQSFHKSICELELGGNIKHRNIPSSLEFSDEVINLMCL